MGLGVWGECMCGVGWGGYAIHVSVYATVTVWVRSEGAVLANRVYWLNGRHCEAAFKHGICALFLMTKMEMTCISQLWRGQTGRLHKPCPEPGLEI